VSTEQEAAPRKRQRIRTAPVSRFKAFDDEFDVQDITQYHVPDENIESQTLPSQDTGATPYSMEEERSQTNGGPSNSRKRDRSPDDDDMVDGFLPAAAALKRRKLEIEKENRRKGISTEENDVSAGPIKQPPTKSKPKKELDIRQAARERREAEEEAARRDHEVLEAKLGDISVKEMKNLAVIEEMEVPDRSERASKANGQASDRWDERWNGRKNFKKFRRKGESNGQPRRQTQNVIVPLVEVQKKTYGIGEAYWSSSRDKENDSGRRSKRSGGLSSQTQTQTQSQPETERPTSPTTTRLQQEAAEIVGEIDVDRPRQTRLADKTQQSQSTMNSSRGKRVACTAASGPAKRQRTIRTRAASDSESDEELRFKFGSRKR
jgi:hypothetical protein